MPEKKIKATAGTTQGFEIVANREGLMGLAVACLQMAMQPEDNEQVVQSGGNHWHFAEWASNLGRTPWEKQRSNATEPS
jgi:hypothetical protein